MIDPNKQIERSQPRGLSVGLVAEMTGYQLTEIALISKTVAIGAPLQELAVFLHACRELRLDPLLRQAYWIRRKDRKTGQEKGTLQVGIDGYRAIADRSGAYAGSEPPVYRGSVRLKVDVDRYTDVPEKASVMVWKIVAGHKAAFTGEAHWAEFYQGDGAQGSMWRKMPHHMLAKCAEGQALRKAFPALLGGVEMMAIEPVDGAPSELPMVNPPSHQVVEAPPRRQYTAADYSAIFPDEQDEAPERPPAQRTAPPEPEPEPDIEPGDEDADEKTALWLALDELVAEATRLKVKTPKVPATATNDQVRLCNAELQRLINAELDRQASRDS